MAVVKVLLSIIYVVLGIAISVVILMQEGKSNGLGSAIGGMADSYWSKNKGRSMEGSSGAFYQIRCDRIYDPYTGPEYSYEDSGIIERDSQNTLRVTDRRVFFYVLGNSVGTS